MGTLGMIAPPLNVPAMVMADGVNMPFAGFALSLWTLSLPTALFRVRDVHATAAQAPVCRPRRDAISGSKYRATGLVRSPFCAVIVFWAIVRYWPASSSIQASLWCL